jgi:hypothetical protein
MVEKKKITEKHQIKSVLLHCDQARNLGGVVGAIALSPKGRIVVINN